VKSICKAFARFLWNYFIFPKLVKKTITAFKLKRLMSDISSPKRLNLGCGPDRKEGWINADILIRSDYYIDVTKKLPFPDNSIDFIFSEHVIEHLTKQECIFFLKECHRVLRIGGILRFSTPDLDLLVKLYNDENPYVSLEEAINRHRKRFYKDANAEMTKCDFFNDKLRLFGSHKFIYDFDLLSHLLLQENFKNITRCRFGESKHPELQNLETHADVEWMKFAEPLIVEAEK